MNPIDQRFASLQANQQKAFMPFVTAGDPDLEFTQQVIQTLDEAGCSFCEVGIPYSDPIADGPVIQSSYSRALDAGVTVSKIFEMATRLRDSISMPLVTMVSWAIVYRRGIESYIDDAKAAGFSGAIIPDLLVDDAELHRATFEERDFKLIPLITPTTPRDRAIRIAQSASGFLYYVSVTGITGERTELPSRLVDDLQWLRGEVSLPICVGFGISSPEQAKQIADVCDGVIVGSAIVRRIQKAATEPRQRVLEDVSSFASQLVSTLQATDT